MGSLTALFVTIVGEIILQWYYVAVVAQQPTKLDTYIKYELLDAPGNGKLSVEMLNLLNLIFTTCGNIMADFLMVSERVYLKKRHI